MTKKKDGFRIVDPHDPKRFETTQDSGEQATDNKFVEHANAGIHNDPHSPRPTDGSGTVSPELEEAEMMAEEEAARDNNTNNVVTDPHDPAHPKFGAGAAEVDADADDADSDRPAVVVDPHDPAHPKFGDADVDEETAEEVAEHHQVITDPHHPDHPSNN